MNKTNERARIASLATALKWAYDATDDPKIRKTLKQVIRWHLLLQYEDMRLQAEEYAEASR